MSTYRVGLVVGVLLLVGLFGWWGWRVGSGGGSINQEAVKSGCGQLSEVKLLPDSAILYFDEAEANIGFMGLGGVCIEELSLEDEVLRAKIGLIHDGRYEQRELEARGGIITQRNENEVGGVMVAEAAELIKVPMVSAVKLYFRASDYPITMESMTGLVTRKYGSLMAEEEKLKYFGKFENGYALDMETALADFVAGEDYFVWDQIL